MRRRRHVQLTNGSKDQDTAGNRWDGNKKMELLRLHMQDVHKTIVGPLFRGGGGASLFDMPVDDGLLMEMDVNCLCPFIDRDIICGDPFVFRGGPRPRQFEGCH